LAYRVVVEDGAARAIRKLDRDVQRLVVARLERLAENPRPPGSKKLEGAEDLHRVRVGDHRIVYRIEDDVLLASLGGPPALPGRQAQFDSCGNVQCTPCREPLKHHDREYPWTTTRA
jgi:mRNA interferase RelE/StbE